MNNIQKAVHNPHNKPIEELPHIWGFNNGGRSGAYYGALITDDGEWIGSHICSNESFMLHDLGIIEGSRPDRHLEFMKHYPDGYRMEFVSYDDVEGHEGIRAAYDAHMKKYPKKEEDDG